MFHDHACLSPWLSGSWVPLPASVASHSIHEHLSLSLGSSSSVLTSVPLIFVSWRLLFLWFSVFFCISLSVYSVHIFFLSLFLLVSLSPSEPCAFSISHHHPFSQSLSLVDVNWPSHR